MYFLDVKPDPRSAGPVWPAAARLGLVVSQHQGNCQVSMLCLDYKQGQTVHKTVTKKKRQTQTS